MSGRHERLNAPGRPLVTRTAQGSAVGTRHDGRRNPPGLKLCFIVRARGSLFGRAFLEREIGQFRFHDGLLTTTCSANQEFTHLALVRWFFNSSRKSTRCSSLSKMQIFRTISSTRRLSVSSSRCPIGFPITSDIDLAFPGSCIRRSGGNLSGCTDISKPVYQKPNVISTMKTGPASARLGVTTS